MIERKALGQAACARLKISLAILRAGLRTEPRGAVGRLTRLCGDNGEVGRYDDLILLHHVRNRSGKRSNVRAPLVTAQIPTGKQGPGAVPKRSTGRQTTNYDESR